MFDLVKIYTNISILGHKLAVGFVVLISLAIALSLIFLLVVAGILAERYRRKRDGYMPVVTRLTERNDNLARFPPEHLLANVGTGGRREGSL